MWIPPFFRPLQAVAFDTFLAVARTLPGVQRLESNNRPPDGIPVFVMMPLDFACENSVIPGEEIEHALSRLAHVGVHGIMVDVWWGLCEKQPREYDFSLWIKLAETCRKLNLKMQATMCFHACGGNVGDFVNIPLPEWVVQAADRHHAWFRDRTQALSFETKLNKEYITFGADHLAFLPCRKYMGSAQGTLQKIVSAGASPPLLSPRNSGTNSSASGLAGLLGEHDSTTAPQSPKASYEKSNGPEARSNEPSSSFAATDAPDPPVRRTPMQAYAEFIEAFCTAMKKSGNYLESVITELQVGLGPCGELRYPSYPMSDDKWKFPGIGEFQSYDPHLLRDLARAAKESGHPESSKGNGKWSVPPDGAGSYNDTPFDTTFFRRDFKSDYGKFFQNWYSKILLRHGNDLLTNVRKIVPVESPVALAVKISGIHWWHWTQSRPAESTAGYYVSRDFNFYEHVAKLFREHSIVFDFTCLEMRTVDQPFLKGRCGPKQLVRDIFRIAAREGVAVAGENALERYDWDAHSQVIKAFKWTDARAHGFTLLRLTPALLEEAHLENLERLTTEMSSLKRRE